jgi:hypothetical protein
VDDEDGMMLYVPFAIDVSALNPEYVIHFDLYAYLTEISTKKKVAIESILEGTASIQSSGKVVFKFAPFSHDGESDYQVPDGGTTLALLGLSLAGLAFISRRV